MPSMMECDSCGKSINRSYKVCPNCRESVKPPSKDLGAAGFVILGAALVAIWIFTPLGDTVKQMVSQDTKQAEADRAKAIIKSGEALMSEIQSNVAKDTVDSYWIAKRNGSAMDACVSAGFVLAAYQQAKDETNYSKWKAIQRADCKEAGLPDS